MYRNRSLNSKWLKTEIKPTLAYSTIVYKGFSFQPDVCIKKVKIKRGKKTVQRVYGMYLEVEDTLDSKIVVPLNLFNTSSKFKGLKSCDLLRVIKNADYFVGASNCEYELKLENPLLIEGLELVICDYWVIPKF